MLRKCVALGGRAGSEKLRDWARRELDGYAGEDELPSYRTIPAPIAVDGMNIRFHFTAQQISPMQLPDFARDVIKAEAQLPHRVAELESMAARGDVVKLQHSGMPDLVAYLNSKADYGTAFHAMYWMVSTAAVAGVLDAIRTTLVSLVAEMRAVGVEDMPTAEAADRAVNVVLHNAKRSTITVNTCAWPTSRLAPKEDRTASFSRRRLTDSRRSQRGFVVRGDSRSVFDDHRRCGGLDRVEPICLTESGCTAIKEYSMTLEKRLPAQRTNVAASSGCDVV